MTKKRNLHLATALAAALSLASAGSLAVDVPKRKSGLWQITNSSPGMPGGSMTMQHCIDEKTDDMMRQSMGSAAEMQCSKQDIKKEADRIVINSVCKLGATTATTKAVFSGKFDSNYRAEISSTYDPPLMGRKDGMAVLEAKWLGPCKPGQKPGDIVMPNGMTINPANMPKLR